VAELIDRPPLDPVNGDGGVELALELGPVAHDVDREIECLVESRLRIPITSGNSSVSVC
jgi:hypothetical protein